MADEISTAAAPVNPNAGVGTATPLAENTGQYQEWSLQAKAAGYSDQDVSDATEKWIKQARDAGYDEQEISHHLGTNDPTRIREMMKSQAIPSLGEWTAPPAEGIGQTFKAGLEQSSGGLEWNKALPEFAAPENMGFGGSLAYTAGTLLGSMADAVVGGAMGAGMGALAGIPSGPGAAITATGGATMGAFVVPAVRREAYMQALIHGQVKDWKDFASQEASVTWEGIKAATIARYTAGAGQTAEQIGGPIFMQTMRKVAGEAAAMTATSSALEGSMPTWSNLANATLTMAAVHGATAPSLMTPGAGRTIMANLADRFVKTGEAPEAAAGRAMADPVLYQDLATPKPVEPPPLSSSTTIRITPGKPDEYVIGKNTPQSDATPPNPASPLHDYSYNYTMGENGVLTPLPPDKPTDFEKGQTYYDFGNVFMQMRWSEGQQKWTPYYNLSPSDWKFQNTLHEPAVGVTNTDITSWWHGSQHLQPALMPSASTYNVKAVWVASDMTTSHGFSKGPVSGTITRVYIMPGKYFDFRDPEQVAHAKTWIDQNTHSVIQEMEQYNHSKMSSGVWETMQGEVMQNYLKSNGYEGYFEREKQGENTPVNLAVYDESKIIRGETSVLGNQLVKMNKYEQHSANAPEDMVRPGTLLSAYKHGERPDPNSIQYLGREPEQEEQEEPAQGGGTQPPKPPAPPLLPPSDAERWDRVAARIGEPVQLGWYPRMISWLKHAYFDLMNDSHPLAQLMDKAYERGVPVPDIENPLFLNKLASVASSDTRATERIVRTLLPIWKPFENESGTHTFWTYAHARMAVGEAVTAGRETGIDFEDAARVMELGHEKYAPAFEKMLDVYNNSLRSLVGGRLSEEQYRSMVAMGDAGLPAIRIEPEGSPEHANTNIPTGAKGKNTIFRRQGSELPILKMAYPIIQRILAREHVAAIDARNKATADLGVKLGEAMHLGSAKVSWTPEEITGMGMHLGGLTDGDDPFTTRIIANKLGWDLRGDTIISYENGIATRTRFQDPNVARLINQLDAPSLTIWSKMMAHVSNMQRTMLSMANPLFAPKIATFYDIPFQHIINPEGRNTLNMLGDGLTSLFDKKAYNDAVQAGALTHVYKSLRDDKYLAKVIQGKADPEYTANVWNLIRNPIDGLKAWSSGWFHAMPLGRYAQGIREGESQTRAAALAQNAVFDPVAGGGPTGRYINLVSQPFFKAYLTGLERTARSMFGIGRDIGGQKFSALQFAGKAIPLVTVPFIANYLQNKDKQWYKDMSPWEKANGLPLRTGGDGPEGVTHYAPFPPLIGFMFGGLPVMVMDAIYGHNPHAFDHLGQDVTGAFAPPAGAFGYSILQPVIEKIANYSFFRGTQLNPGYMDKLLPQEKFYPYTSWTAKKMSSAMNSTPWIRGLNMTPIEIDNFVQSLSGNAGRFVVAAAEKAAKFAKVLPDKAPAESLWDLPGLASFHSRWPTPGAQPIVDFEDRMKTNAMYSASLQQALVRGDPDRFKELTQEDPTALLNKIGGVPSSANPTQDFLGSLDAASQQLRQNLDPISKVLRADQLIKLDRQAVSYISNLPNDTQLSNTQKSALMEYQRAVHTQQPGVPVLDLATISAVDKKQLLDTLYANMSITAQYGISAMDKANMK